jgi:[protein-PII] uridylyltransferase
MGLRREVAEDIAWLAAHHLLLSDTATRRDTGDENLVVETAAAIGSAERLKMLYLLSVADGRATGPTAWSPWKATLVGELFTKILRVLEEGRLVGPDATEVVRLRSAELRAALTRYPSSDVEAHLSGMPRAYFLAFPTNALIRHFAVMAELAGPNDVRVHVAKTEALGVTEVAVAAPDRPGLFSNVAGALALNGINVLSGQVFTRKDGTALEVFRVTGTHEDEIDPSRWERVRSDVAPVLAGDRSLDDRITAKRDAYTRPSKGKREEPRVLVENRASDFYTVVEVHATDRVGLLYAITDALASLGLDIHSAKVATYAEDVVDVFYIRDGGGQKVTEPEKIRRIERTVLARIGA